MLVKLKTIMNNISIVLNARKKTYFLETLTISGVKFEDAGDYVCVSKSLTEVSSAPVSVSVSGLLH